MGRDVCVWYCQSLLEIKVLMLEQPCFWSLLPFWS